MADRDWRFISCVRDYIFHHDEDREYFEAYLEKYAALGAKIYLLEYTNGSSIDLDIRDFCWAHDYGYYISDSIDLD